MNAFAFFRRGATFCRGLQRIRGGLRFLCIFLEIIELTRGIALERSQFHKIDYQIKLFLC